MSVCLIATYPWADISGYHGLGPAGVVVCSDTRVVAGSRPLSIKFSKQLLNARNILICFTSSHVAATQAALKHAWGTRSVKQLGQSIRETHKIYGGAAELVATVWRGEDAPQVLEVMPPDYVPRPQGGVIGIGDPAVLRWIADNFPTDPPPEPLRLTAEMLQSLSAVHGAPVTPPPPPSFLIDQAALRVSAALAEGIREAGGPTVALPIQVMTVQSGTVLDIGVSSSTVDLDTFEDVTPVPGSLNSRRFDLVKIPNDDRRRRAVEIMP